MTPFPKITDKNMKVRIVCYEDLNKWILGKFAKKLNQELNNLSIQSDISNKPDPTADINHHIIYYHYRPQPGHNDTLMITHIDSIQKLNLLKNQLKTAKIGICMSKETVKKLTKAGIPKNKLTYINPAHDGVIKPRKLILGITSKVNQDGRKKQNNLIKICQKISPNDFSFKIMGSGWEKIIKTIKEMGFEVDYFNVFDYQKYTELIPQLDYYLYFSYDEGSMGFIDALAGGVKTIVTPQGYHLDAKNGISYPVKNINEIIKTLNSISQEKSKLTSAVSEWTWENYAKKHIKLWKNILNSKTKKNNHIKHSYSLGTKLSYVFKPLSLYNFIWDISPSVIKNIYKKRYDKKNQKPDQTSRHHHSK